MSGHWYTKSGEPCHYQPDGKDTTLRHARKQDLVPSVTGILDVAAKPQLTNYFISQHLEAAYAMDWHGVPTGEDYPEWCKEVRQMAGEHSKQARDKGTAIHHALDCYYGETTEDIDPEYNKYVAAVAEEISDKYNFDGGDFESEKTFATEQWGGSVDLSNPSLVLDYKTKASEWEMKKDGTPKKIWYQSNISQIAAYRFGLGYKGAKCANVFISPSAKVYIKEYTEDELKHGLEYYAACLKLWQLTNNFGV